MQPHGQANELVVLAGTVRKLRDSEQGLPQGIGRPRGQGPR